MKFVDLRLNEPILRTVASEGYSVATPIQAGTIPHVLDGRDVLGSAQTGTGKTAAFALPALHRLSESSPPKGKTKRPRCLVLGPTRELVRQIADSFVTYGQHLSINGTVIFGGVNQNPQVKALRRGVDVIVATPGRLQDLMGQGHVDLSAIEMLVLDEADRMLDMGFIRDIQRIVEHLPKKRQTLLFSATMPREIRHLADTLLSDPATVEVTPEKPTVDAIDQSVYFVTRKNKPTLLAHLLGETSISRAIVFTRTKHGADRVVKQLRTQSLPAEAIHGNKTQNARERALKNFTLGRTNVLVATDIAARGIDVDGISHVINYDLTHEPETYVHRIGRTARAGASGAAISFCDHDERGNLLAIQQLIRKNIAVRTDCPDYTETEQSMMAGMIQSPLSSTGGNRSRRRPARNRNANAGGSDRPRRPRAAARGGKADGGHTAASKPRRRRGGRGNSGGHAGS
ncbi:DEAD/DEAH box helicase [Phycisphaerales bacterium AB-hyl4]|uniref:DEAD/DEAH box helicase n=1 Tax=Natronomicrosphaera hydrolytica TaxID=3242702 RepID=A0ABV4U8A6_9BACT